MGVDLIQPLLAPVLLVSACGLMILSLNTREMTVKARLRAFNRERLDLYIEIAKTRHAGPAQRRRFDGLASQAEGILQRARLVRASLACMVACVAGLLLCSLMIGLSHFAKPFGVAAAWTFVASVAVMLVGAVIFLCELRHSLRDVREEYAHIRDLTLEDALHGKPHDVPTPESSE